MAPMLIKRWDADTREHVYYNADGSTTTDPDDAEVWDDELAAKLAAEEYGATVSAAFDEPDDDSKRVG